MIFKYYSPQSAILNQFNWYNCSADGRKGISDESFVHIGLQLRKMMEIILEL